MTVLPRPDDVFPWDSVSARLFNAVMMADRRAGRFGRRGVQTYRQVKGEAIDIREYPNVGEMSYTELCERLEAVDWRDVTQSAPQAIELSLTDPEALEWL